MAGRVGSFFLRDKGRFPPESGHALQPGVWATLAEGRTKSGAVVASAAWGLCEVNAGNPIDLRLTI